MLIEGPIGKIVPKVEKILLNFGIAVDFGFSFAAPNLIEIANYPTKGRIERNGRSRGSHDDALYGNHGRL
jgi:hypothetical protein